MCVRTYLYPPYIVSKTVMLKFSLIVLGVLTVLVIMSRWVYSDPNQNRSSHPQPLPSKNLRKGNEPGMMMHQNVQFLISEVNNNLFLAHQDQHAVVAIVHLATANAYLNCLMRCLPLDSLLYQHKFDGMKVTKDIKRFQAELAREISSLLPQAPIPSSLLVQ